MNQVSELPKVKHSNVAGIEFNSMYQANSLFTLSAVFKDGNKAKLHSWRQEIRTKIKTIDQEHPYKRLVSVAEVCTCRNNAARCFHCNHKYILIICNLTDTIIYKRVHNKLNQLIQLRFGTTEKGNTFLTFIGSENVVKNSMLHGKKNFLFNETNQ